MSLSMVSRWKLRSALRELQKLHIPFSGPFTTPLKNRLYVINDSLLTEPEIIASLKGGGPPFCVIGFPRLARAASQEIASDKR